MIEKLKIYLQVVSPAELLAKGFILCVVILGLIDKVTRPIQ